MTMILQHQLPLPYEAHVAGMVRLATEIYCRAQSDVRSAKSSQGARMARASAASFLANDPLAQSVAEVNDCDESGAVGASYEIEHRYFIELNDPRAGGQRGLTDALPIVIKGYVQPLRRSRRGISNVIIVEEPKEFAETWRALPTDEWIVLDRYNGPAGYITESEYARLLSRVPGVQAEHISAARRRALDENERGRG